MFEFLCVSKRVLPVTGEPEWEWPCVRACSLIPCVRACVLTYPCDLPPSLPPQPHRASAHLQADPSLGWPKPRNSGREGWHGPGVTVALNQMGLGLARDPTHSLWGRRCFGSVVLGGRPVARGCQFFGVSGRPLCLGS